MNKWSWLLLFLLIIIIGYFIYQTFFKSDKGIYPDTAKRLIAENYFDYIIDVRTVEEWNTGNYPSAIRIGMERLVFDLPQAVKDVSSKILFYCAKGRRAAGASVIADKLGYVNNKYLVGGYTDLIN
jgi:rhodanese-related sulfurtransferase